MAWLQDGEFWLSGCCIQRLVAIEVRTLSDHLKHTEALTHGVVLGGNLSIVEPFLSDVTSLAIAIQIGNCHY